MQHGLWAGVGGLVAMAVASSLLERRRSRRRDIDRIGMVPWTTVQISCLIAAAMLALFTAASG